MSKALTSITFSSLNSSLKKIIMTEVISINFINRIYATERLILSH
ncbi:hypothetical protein OIU78_028479 [Salix suchowensis]|nr:hypothetical protein OIU78_028479 [Salix suchowensis]